MVHLELTNDMTTEEFLQALRSMYYRRGLCNTLWSDNQTTFKKADKDIQWLFEASSQKINKVWKKLVPSQLQRETSFFERNQVEIYNGKKSSSWGLVGTNLSLCERAPPKDLG